MSVSRHSGYLFIALAGLLTGSCAAPEPGEGVYRCNLGAGLECPAGFECHDPDGDGEGHCYQEPPDAAVADATAVDAGTPCGNGVLETDEECDSTELAGATCRSLGYFGGELACTDECTLDVSVCAVCGDGECEVPKLENALTCPADCAWSAIAAGSSHTCRIDGAGVVTCWGSDNELQLGDGDVGRPDCGSGPCSPFPVSIELQGTDVLRVTAGAYHGCLSRGAEQQVWCWGENENGQVGDQSLLARAQPVQVSSPPTGVKQLSAGRLHTCAVDLLGDAWCWGMGWDGRLGNGEELDQHAPVGVVGLTDVTMISAATIHTCAVDAVQSLWCWGSNTYSQLGIGSFPTRSATPLEVVGLGPVLIAAAGSKHTCALLEDRTVWCWGENRWGQLGRGTTDSVTQPDPEPVVDLDDVVWLTTYNQHTCALRADHSAWCWGVGANGQLGDGLMETSPSPVLVAGHAFVNLSVGGSHSCGVKVDGSAWCWGLDLMGQVGDGPPTDSTPIATPRQVVE